MNKPAIHRVPANSKLGRRMVAVAKPPKGVLTQEQIDWNARIDRLKEEKRLKKGK